MSHNHSRAEKSEPHVRRSGRSGNSLAGNHHRGFNSGGGGGRGSGGYAHPGQPHSSSVGSNSNSFLINRSSQKHGNGQGGQYRVNSLDTTNTPVGGGVPINSGRAMQNGVHPQPRHVSEAQPSSGAKPVDMSSSKTSRPYPRPPNPQISEGLTQPSQLQFGSLNMNSFMIPARTTSAPPNLNEQAHHGLLKAGSVLPIHIGTNQKQEKSQPKKDVIGFNHANAVNSDHLSHAKKESHASIPVHSDTNAYNSSRNNVPFVTMYQQQKSSIQFSSGPQIQSQNCGASQLPISINPIVPPPVGTPSQSQQSIYYHNQSHVMQPSGMMHQGHNMAYAQQITGQMPYNMGIGIAPQYSQQPVGKFAGNPVRRMVKITDPETHEEVKLSQSDPSFPTQKAPSSSQSSGINHPIIQTGNTFTHDTVQSTAKSADIISSEKSGTHYQKTTITAYNDDAIKTEKPIKEISPSLQNGTKANMDISTQLFKSVPEPLDNFKFSIADSDKHHTDMPFVGSLEITKSNDLLSAVPSQVVGPITSNKNCQKKTNIKDFKNPQQQASEDHDHSQINSRISASSEVGSSEIKDSTAVPSSSSSKHSAIFEATGTTKNIHSVFSIPSVVSTGIISPEKPLHYDAREPTTLVEICKSAKTCDTSGDSCDNKLADPFQGANNPKQEDIVTSETMEKKVIGDSIESEHKLMDPKENFMTKNLNEKPLCVSSGVSASNTHAETACMKTTSKKMKRKNIISKADAAGTNSDLYMAYKGPEEKVVSVFTSENVDSSFVVDPVCTSGNDSKKKDIRNEQDTASKAEVDDWEDVVYTNSQHGSASKKFDYSKDFLLTFQNKYTDLPAIFNMEFFKELVSLQVGKSNNDRRSPSNSGRSIDRPNSSDRADYRMVGASNRDIRYDFNYGQSGIGSHSGSGGNQGGGRFPRGQSNQYTSGNISGPVHGGMSHGYHETDRWQRAPGIQRGLIPSPPHTQFQAMHRAEKKYEVGKISNEEEIKQRQLKAILNKLTPQNFEKLFEKVKEVNIDSAHTLTGVISQIFDKALMEPTFCEMYSDFCFHLSGALPDFNEDNEKITFKRLLLNKCQEEFERGEKEEAEANNVERDGEMTCNVVEREEKKLRARRRMLGNIRLIGELYKKKMLTERIMHECIKKLIGKDQTQYENPDEEDIEALCKLMSTIGVMIDHYKSKDHIDAYFDIMSKLSNNLKLSSRLRFMLKDSIDLRRNKWQQRRKVEGPKKIDEVHRDVVQERQAQTSRLTRGPIGSSGRRGGPVEYGSRMSTFSPSPARNFQPPARSFGGQDVRLGDRHPLEGKTQSIPLPQRPTSGDSITLGPQGGLARGMSTRAQPLTVNSVPNYHSSPSDRFTHSSREAVIPKYSQDQEQYFGNRDHRNAERVSDRPLPSTITVNRQESFTETQNSNPEVNPLSRDLLLKKSISTIKEYYSAKDEKEVALCIIELNSPTFYPCMVSSWIADSFERKDIERDLLSKLLINLCRDKSLISHAYLIQGFEYVLSTLEDAVNDAPKAPEFLGRIFANMMSENVISLNEVGRLVREGGEEIGGLIDSGLAAAVVGSTLQNVKVDQGDSVLKETIIGSNLKLVDFKPPQPCSISRKLLDPFL